MSMVTAMTHSMMTSVYDNSKAFDRYLFNYGLDDALKRNKLKRRVKHAIVPHVSPSAFQSISELIILYIASLYVGS